MGSCWSSTYPNDPNQFWRIFVLLWFDPNGDQVFGMWESGVSHLLGARGVAQPGLARHLGVVEVVGSNPAAPIFGGAEYG